MGGMQGTVKPERLDKILSKLLFISRSQAAALIKAGRVRVDEQYPAKGDFKVGSDALIYLDEELVEAAGSAGVRRVFIMNKAAGCVCADRDKRYPTVHNYLTDVPRREELHCAGRLDLDTRGLLVITDDGSLIHEITAPKKQVSKTYVAALDRDIPPGAEAAFARGVKHPEEKERYQGAALLPLAPRLALVQVSEGRYHEVKRLFETQNCNVVYLKRVAIGALCLSGDLLEGRFRVLPEEEIPDLFAAADNLQVLAERLSLAGELDAARAAAGSPGDSKQG